MVQFGPICSKIVLNALIWSNIVQNGSKWCKIDQNGAEKKPITMDEGGGGQRQKVTADSQMEN